MFTSSNNLPTVDTHRLIEYLDKPVLSTVALLDSSDNGICKEVEIVIIK